MPYLTYYLILLLKKTITSMVVILLQRTLDPNPRPKLDNKRSKNRFHIIATNP